MPALLVLSSLYSKCFIFIPDASTASIVLIKSFHLREQSGNDWARRQHSLGPFDRTSIVATKKQHSSQNRNTGR
jgi:hypothetical protein